MAAGRTDIRVSSVREDSHGLAGGPRLERAVDAARALSDLLWEEVHEQLGSAHAREDRAPVDGDARRHSAQLAERIADLASTVALLASGDGCATAPPGPRARSVPRVSPPAGPAIGPRSSAVLIDERDELSDAPHEDLHAMARQSDGGQQTSPHGPHDDAPFTDRWWTSNGRRAHDGGEQDDCEEQRAWLGLIGSALAQFERDHVPFAALLIEVLDAGVPANVNRQITRAVAGVLDEISPVSILPECSNRYWLIVPRADRRRARAVADRLTRVLGPSGGEGAGRHDAADRYFAAISARRSPPRTSDSAARLRLAVGTSACPDNGRDLSALVAWAHIELAAARSASLPVIAATEQV